MQAKYHIQILQEALGQNFSQRALETIIAGNLGQDGLRGQLWHPEYHFDNNSFMAGGEYIEEQRQLVVQQLDRIDVPARLSLAWKAFGRLTHAAQDFYAHSNYVTLWIDRHTRGKRPPPEEIDPLEPQLISSPRLRSGRVYYPLEVLYFVPFLSNFIKGLLPADSHARMNLDSPKQGPFFAYAYTAARRRTEYEFNRTLALTGRRVGSEAVKGFLDLQEPDL